MISHFIWKNSLSLSWCFITCHEYQLQTLRLVFAVSWIYQCSWRDDDSLSTWLTAEKLGDNSSVSLLWQTSSVGFSLRRRYRISRHRSYVLYSLQLAVKKSADEAETKLACRRSVVCLVSCDFLACPRHLTFDIWHLTGVCRWNNWCVPTAPKQPH
jgi:hypothetical protein